MRLTPNCVATSNSLSAVPGTRSTLTRPIADFRSDNGAGILNVCRRFIGLCRDLKLFTHAIVAIDGSKFKAVNSRDRNFTPGKIDGRQRQSEQSIQRYLDALETADRTQPAEVEAKTERLQDKIKKLREQMKQLDDTREELKKEPDGQRPLTDPDARSMNSQATGSGLVGYNVQAVVEPRHHLIVAHEVTNVGSDRAQHSRMAKAAREAMGKTKLQALADRGYFNGAELKACEDAGILTYVPKPMTSNAKAEGRFDKSDFVYIAKEDEDRCPAAERAIYRCNTLEKNGNEFRVYWTSACPRCLMKEHCTTGDYRRIRRWEHEAVLERAQQRLDRKPVAMMLRRCTAEHVFGTLKYWMGSTHFRTKTL